MQECKKKKNQSKQKKILVTETKINLIRDDSNGIQRKEFTFLYTSGAKPFRWSMCVMRCVRARQSEEAIRLNDDDGTDTQF